MNQSKPRIAFIIQRYGEQITGGSESHCRQIAERLAVDHDVEVITSCAADHLSWQNVMPPGAEMLNGVRVRRFPSLEERRLMDFHRHYDRIFLTQLSPQEEYEMIRFQGPYTPALVQYVEKHQNDYDAFIVFTYMYYPAVHTLPILKDKAIFVPTAHDETALYVHILDNLFHQTPHIFFNTEEEQFLLQRRFNLPSAVGRVVGLGIAEPVAGEPDAAWEGLQRKLKSRLVLTYTGRVENGKGCDELVEFFLRFAKDENCKDAVLLLMGRRTLPLTPHPQILSTGFVSEFMKYQALQTTDIGIASSPFESLCMAALETWMHGKPMLVNGRSPVLVGHCLRSNGGLWYSNYEEFRETVKVLLADSDLRAALGSQGRAYVRSQFQWQRVEEMYREVIAEIIAGKQNGAGARGLPAAAHLGGR
jgi:glycosyltransferase involved in cell wall biosynthesis